MRNVAQGPFPIGVPADPATTGQIMAFQVSLTKSAIPDTLLPAELNTIVPLTPQITEDKALFETTDSFDG